MRRLRTGLLVLLGVIAAYGVLGAFVAPRLARNAIVKELEARLGRHVELDRLVANPYTLQVRAEGFRILERDGHTRFAGFDALDLDASASSFVHFAPVIDEARLQGLRVHLVREDATHYNVDDIVARLAAAARAPKETPAGEPARFSVSNIQLTGGTLEFDDHPAHATHQVAGMQLAIPVISNFATHRRDRVQPAFSATINGAPFKLAGEALPFENTVRTRFTLDIQGVDLARYLGYLPADAPVRLERGHLEARLVLQFTQAPGHDPAVNLAGTVRLADLALVTPEGPLARLGQLDVDLASLNPLAGKAHATSVKVAAVDAMQGEWKVDAASASDLDLDLASHAVKVGAVDASGARLHLVRRADGSLEMPRIPPSEHPTAWAVAVHRLGLDGVAVTLHDASVKPALDHEATFTRIEGRDLTTDHGFAGQLDVKARLARGGSLDLASTFALEPLDLTAKVDARGVDLVPVRAYVSQFPAVSLRGGLASAQGTLAVQGSAAAPRIRYQGSVQVDRFATFDTLNHEDLLNWKRIRTTGLQLDVAPGAPLKLAVADIDVVGAYSRIFVNPEGKLNLQQLLAATPQTPDPPPATTPPRPREVRIDRIRFEDSRLNFSDHYIRPNYTADVGDVKGAVTQLSSDPASRATVMLAGRWDSSSPVVIAGTINPLSGNLFLDIAAQGQQIDLTKLTAYSQRYAGYGIKAGRLTLDVKYHVEGGKMQGRNRILVDQLAFGDKVESPDATSLPVLFLVNLLKDKDGRINLELPVSGSLDDPKFEIGAVISQMFSSHFAKAQSSPFALLAGGSGAEGDLGFVDFEAGHSELSPAAQAKLQKLVALLQDRPGLKLEIAPASLAPQDVAALQAIARQRRDAAAKDLSKEAREKLAQQPVEVADADREALLQGRVEQVRTYLTGESRLGADRVVLASGTTAAAPTGSAAASATSRVTFALR